MSPLEERMRISPKRTFAVLGFFLAAGLWYMQTSPDDLYDGHIRDLTNQVTEIQKKVNETAERFNNKKKFQDEMEQVSQTFRLALDFLPKELDTQDLLKKISIEARKAGVQLGKFNPKEPAAKDFYDELPIEISVKGEYGQILTFLVSVSKLPRIVTVRNVEIGSPVLTDHAANLNMTGVLVAYRYKETK